ncbi:hypothetical protein T492DRAFT_850862 [Pavlovales sp. CCMP2436]|nr:hypothetical protein T492DRAFT_850862 [Pavlovales sp. CCMP2436]
MMPSEASALARNLGPQRRSLCRGASSNSVYRGTSESAKKGGSESAKKGGSETRDEREDIYSLVIIHGASTEDIYERGHLQPSPFPPDLPPHRKNFNPNSPTSPFPRNRSSDLSEGEYAEEEEEFDREEEEKRKVWVSYYRKIGDEKRARALGWRPSKDFLMLMAAQHFIKIITEWRPSQL